MRLSIENKIRAGFGLAAAFLLLIGLIAWWNARRDAEMYREAARTHDAIDQIKGTLLAIVNAQTGTHGFGISGDEKSLEPYQASVGEVQSKFVEMNRLMQDNPRQQSRLAELEPIVQKQLRYQVEVIQRRRAGDSSGVLQLIASGQGEQSMDEIRKLIGTMTSAEEQLFQERSARAQTLAQWVIVIEVAGSLLAILFVSVAGRMVQRDFQKRQEAEAERDRFVTMALDMF